MKDHTDCPKCKSVDVEEIDTLYLDSEGGKILFECLDCECKFTQEYGQTTTWFKESIEVLK